jgi:NTE family protein
MVAFEIARRHRFAADLASLPDGVAVHVLPSGTEPPTARTELDPRRYGRVTGARERMNRAYDASMRYLGDVSGEQGR